MSITIKKRIKTKKLSFTQENIDKYKTDECILPWNRKDNDPNNTNMLKHAKCNENTQGFFLVSETDKLIGYISWEQKMITSFEVVYKYQHKGYGIRLMKYALKAGCNKLTVNAKNEKAILFYKFIGFKIISMENNNIEMRISEKDINKFLN